MKRLLVTDTHLGLYSDADAWLNIVVDFFKHIVKYCYKNDIHEIIHLGDFFDNRKSLNTKTQNAAHRIAKILAFRDIHTYIIVGNHDCYYKNQIHPNTLELFSKYENITVVDQVITLDGGIVLVPWNEIPERRDEDKYCLGHFAIKGFHMNDSYRCKDGLDHATFKDYDKVLSGHFHTPSSNHNITYLGAPYGQTFHDAGGIRGFHTFEDGKLEFIEYKDAPKFVKIHTTAEPLDENSVTGNIVRIIFTKDFGTVQNQQIIDNVLEHKPFLYSVDFTNINSDEEAVTEDVTMESKEQIVDQFIDTQQFPVNIQINILKSMFKKMMAEAGKGSIKQRSAEGTKIECLEIGFKNFLSFGSKWQDIPLHKGVNFVTGLDMDKGKSNGAGKSSFLETIPFALFGKTARDIRQDQKVNWKNKKNCQVIFRFKINDKVYEINRKLKPGKLEIYKDGSLIDQDAHKADYQAMFEDIFGMDVKMFMSLVHSNVNSSANIMGMKKADKRKFLERMFGLEIYSDMNKLCNEKLKSIEEKDYKHQVDFQAAKEKIETAKRTRTQFQLDIKSRQADIENVQESEEELQRLLENNPNLDEDVKNLEQEIDTKREAFRKVTSEFDTWKAKLETEVEHLQKEIKQLEDLEEQRKKNEQIQARIEKIQEKAGKIDKIKEKIIEQDGNYAHLSKKVEDENEKVSEVEKELVELRTNLKTTEKNLEQLASGICPTCGQDVTDPQTHYSKERTSLKRKITAREKKLEKIKTERSSLSAARDDTALIIRTLETAKTKLLELENQLKEAGSAERKDELVSEKNAKIEKIQKALTLYNEKDGKHSDEMEALKHKLEDLMAEQTRINAKKKDLDIIKTQAAEIEKHIESLRVMIKEQDAIIDEAKSKQNTIDSKIVMLKGIGDYIRAIKNILKDENIKQYTIKQIIPYLNKQTNHYLSEVNYSFYVDIDGWLELDIKGPGIRNASYYSLSGGERRGIDIALQLSLLDIARTQAGIFPDLLVFDELLDSSIDGRGINELMKIVRVKQKEFDGKIFIISHRDEIDNEMVDFQYKVVKQNGYSKVII